MKRLLLPLVAALALPTAVNAETWVQAANLMHNNAKPGTVGYELCKTNNSCGLGLFIDVKSIVKRGNFVYFNFDTKFVDNNAVPKDREFDAVGWTADCEKELLGPNLKMKLASGNAKKKLLKFVCD
tara:strand:- start:205 stop:582 length:378 start_codon:yes stop_codon:yes gene_type:complete